MEEPRGTAKDPQARTYGMKRWVKQLAEAHPEPSDFLRELHQAGHAPPDTDKALRVAEVLLDLGLPGLAASTLQELLSKSARLTIDERAEAHRLLGNAHMELAEFDDAEVHVRTSLRLYRDGSDTAGITQCLSDIGVLSLCVINDFQRALRILFSGLRAAHRMNANSGEAGLWHTIGWVYSELEGYDNACRCYEKAMALYASVGDTAGVAHSHNGLAIARMAVRDYVRASAHYERALALYTEIGDSKRVANTLNNIGIMHREAGDLEAALACLGKSIALYQDSGDTNGESKCLFDTAEVERDLGRIGRAMQGYRLSLEMERRMGERTVEAWCHMRIGDCHRLQGAMRQAIREYAAGVRLFRDPREPSGLTASALHQLGRAFAAVGSSGAALRCFSEAVELVEKVRVGNMPPPYRRDFWRKNVGIFDELVAAHVRMGSRSAALEASERGKGRAIADMMITRGVDPERFNPTSMNFRQMQDLAGRLEKTLVMLRVTDKGTFAFTLASNGELDLAEVPEFTAKRLGDLVLQTEDGKPTGGWFGSYLRYRASQDEASVLMAQGGLAEALKLVHVATNHWYSTMESTLAVLHEELIGKVFERLPKASRVVLVPNRALNILPLHACFGTEEGQRQYLLEDYEITYTPNCNLLDLCERREVARERQSATDPGLFAVANPAPPYDLVFSEWEVQEIAKHFPVKDVLVRVGARQALLDRGRNARVIHLSTHGIHDIGSPFNARLTLGKDDDLTLEDVFRRLRLHRSWLVCLSACESGLTDHRDIADEFLGLQAGFLHAGAPSVIASLWRIADYTTTLLMEKLYGNIYDGNMSKAAALRDAQLWLKGLTAGEALGLVKAMEEASAVSEGSTRLDISPVRRAISLYDPDSKPFSDPCYWAGYQLFGV